MSEYILSEDLAVWFGKKKKPKGSKQPKGPWVNICRTNKDGSHPPCGRPDSDKGGYPKCRAAGVAGKMSDSEKKSACSKKRKVEKKDKQTGKGQKPNMVSNKKNESINESTYMLLEAIVGDSIVCDDCGWTWKIKDGGDDLYNCHKCGHDNTPNIVEDDEKQVKPSNKVIKSICDSKKFCSAQGPITFGQLKSIVNIAKNKRLAKHIGEGSFKALIRLTPWFIPQIAVAGMFSSAMRAVNKILGPTLKETPSYKSWWSKAIMKVFSFAEGDINPSDPFSKIFFISDGLMNLMDDENTLKFAYHISNVAAAKPDNEPVPEFFVENELRNWVNKRFLLDPPLGPKELESFEDVKTSFDDSKEEDNLTENIQNVLNSFINTKENITDGMKYHIDNNIPISENVFRPGSEKYFSVINEARALKQKGVYLNEYDSELLESDLGKFFNYNGLKLPLDHPLIKEDADKEMVDGIIDILNQVKDIKNREEIAKNMINQFDKENVEYDLNGFMMSIGLLNEAEYKGKNVDLGKPKTGGSKKWYVYVKNPKTGKVIKVSYGSPVMSAKWNDPGARASFAARHQCEKKKDRTKAGYWACRAHKDFGKNVPGRYW
tara:strand:+ start:1826 stop:3634 length:1809 start_codon:yes stop_codon:yes gene_type:complete